MAKNNQDEINQAWNKKIQEMEIQGETIRDMFEALDEDPSNIDNHLTIVKWLFEQKAYDDIPMRLKKALEIDPKNPEALALQKRLKEIQNS